MNRLSLLLLSLLILAGCSNVPSPVAERTVGTATPASPQTIAAGDKVLPNDWPIPMNSTVTRIEGDDSKNGSFIVFHDAPVSAISSFYRQEFTQRGWKVQELANTPLSPVVFAAVGPHNTAKCYFSPEGARSHVRVSVSSN